MYVEVSTGDFAGRFIFLVSFLGLFVLLVSVIAVESPSLFADEKTDYDAYLPPNYLTDKISPDEIKTLVHWGNTTSDRGSTDTLTIQRGDLSDIDIEITWQQLSGDFEQWVFHKYWYDWGFWKKTEDVLPDNPQNSRSSPQWLCEDDLFYEDNLDETLNFSRIDMYDNAFNYVTFVTFDEASYANLSEAMEDGHVIISMGMGWEYESSIVSGWDLIARLLVFQAPQIHPLINAIIALPIIASVTILIFTIAVIIVKSLPFT